MCLGIPGKLVEINDLSKMTATVDIAGVRRQINIACIVKDGEAVESCIGKWVLVHVGFAMAIIEEEEAHKTLELLAELGEAQEEMDRLKQSTNG